MEKYYYFKKTETIAGNKKESIEYLKESEFYLRFGGKFDHILCNFCVETYMEKNIEISFEKREIIFFMDFVNNWNKYKKNWSDLEAISFYDLSEEQQNLISKEIEKRENYERALQNDTLNKKEIILSNDNTKERTQKNKVAGNGEGSLCYNKKLKKWEYYYFNTEGKRKVIRQNTKKGETPKEFKARVTELKNKLNNGTYIEKSYDTVISLAKEHINRKKSNDVTSDRSYVREEETIKEIERTCGNFCHLPIQKVTLQHIEDAKVRIRETYANSVIDKIWGLLNKVFAIASSPSRKILEINIMNDEELKKPISAKKTKKVKSLKEKEFNKLIAVLDGEEKNHKYRNIVKMQCISGMRIGEVLARSKNDYNVQDLTFNVHNTITEDKNHKIILGEHTKTYNKKTQIDEGQRFLPLDNMLFKELKSIVEMECSKKITNIHNLLFWDYKKNTFVHYKEINSWLSRLNEKYHICKDALSTHRIRHTALTRWYHKHNIPLKDIQYLAGHVEGSDITEDVYIDTSLEDVKNTLNNLKMA